MSVHSWTFIMMTDRPCGIQDSNMVAARMDSQHKYSPLAAVYSSWTRVVPIHKDISQRPAHTAVHRRRQVWRRRQVQPRERHHVATTYLAVWGRSDWPVKESHTWRSPAEWSEQAKTHTLTPTLIQWGTRTFNRLTIIYINIYNNKNINVNNNKGESFFWNV